MHLQIILLLFIIKKSEDREKVVVIVIRKGTYVFRVKRKHDWGRGFVFLLFQITVLRESRANSDGIKPASDFIIKNHQTTCSIWCPM